MDVRLAKVLIAAGANVNERRESGTLLLIDMVRRGRAPERQREMVELLLASGADVHARSFEDGRTVLHYATRAEVVRLLLAAGADVNAADCAANTPISRTVGNVINMPRANLELMRQLLEAGAHPPQQAVARMRTVAAGDERIVALLGRATVIAPEPYRDGPCWLPGRPSEMALAQKAWGDRHGLRLSYFAWEWLSGPLAILAWFSPPFLLAIGGLIARDFALGACSAPLLLLILVVTVTVLSFVPSL
jgi:hypothetical protein